MSTFWKTAFGAAIGVIVPAGVIGFLTWFFADPIGLFGGVHESDFSPYEICADNKQIYIPEHTLADDKGCVHFSPRLALLDKAEIDVPASSMHTPFDLSQDAVLVVSAFASAKRVGAADISSLGTVISVTGKLCTSDKRVVTHPVPDDFLIDVSAACVVALPPGKHSLLVFRTAEGVKKTENKFSVRYVLLSE